MSRPSSQVSEDVPGARATRCSRGPRDHHKANRISAKFIPPFLILCAAFSCYAWFYMSISWFLRNGHTATGVCLIVFQIVLLGLMGGNFFRVLLTPVHYAPNRADRQRVQGSTNSTSTHASDEPQYPQEPPKTYDRPPSDSQVRQYLAAPSVVDAPIYLADRNGTDSPRYCSVCDIFKSDRMHHCAEINRCVPKFDHYCPWVGGPLGHTRYKFFVLFITYVAIYCIFCFVTLVIATVQRLRAIHQGLDRHIPSAPAVWYVAIGLAIFYGIMMVPFSLFHIHLVCINKSTVEYINAMPAEVIVNRSPNEDRQRILLKHGMNPFDLGLWGNLQQTFGTVRSGPLALYDILNWVLPFKCSPGDGMNFPYSQAAHDDIALKLKTYG